MGTLHVMSTNYCAHKSSCVLVDAWLQLALCLIVLCILVLLCVRCCCARRDSSSSFLQAPRWATARRHKGVVPFRQSIIQRDATSANIQSHKNSKKQAAQFMLQTQRVTKMDFATMKNSGRHNSRLSTGSMRKRSTDGPVATMPALANGPAPSAATKQLDALTNTIVFKHRLSKEFIKRRATQMLHRRQSKDKPDDKDAIAIFDEPTYGEKHQLAELSADDRTENERRSSMVLRDKRRVSVGSHAFIQFQVNGEDQQANVYEVKLTEIQLVKRLAFGPLSEVYAAIWRDTRVGVKLLMPREGVVDNLEDAVKNFRREIWVMNELKHPNILKLVGASLTPSCYVLVMEYMPNGSLYDYLRDEDNFFPGPMIINSAYDIAAGMRTIHEHGILQRDLKSKNCLLSENLVVKVADFGLARYKDKSHGEYTFVGTPFWAAPEVIRHEQYDDKADVYSYAVVLWELVERKDPYGELNAFQVPYLVANEGLRPADFTNPAPLGLDTLMRQCWDADPEQRPEFAEIAETLLKWMKPQSEQEAELSISSHIQREKDTANANELHRFAASHGTSEKVIPILLSSSKTTDQEDDVNQLPTPRRTTMLWQDKSGSLSDKTPIRIAARKSSVMTKMDA